MRLPEPINPYSSPSAPPDAPVAGDPRLRLARRVRWQVRALSLLWFVAGGVVLGEPLNMYSGMSLMDKTPTCSPHYAFWEGALVSVAHRRFGWGHSPDWLGVHCALRLRESSPPSATH
jgi:hypothetical protein